MRRLFYSSLFLLCLLALAGCGTNGSEQAATPTIASSETAAPTATIWVPPTALVGTPIPGAEATLTAAPRLKMGMVSFATRSGETVNMTVEIADDEPSRQLGLMFRSSLPEYAGMLFDFGGDTTSTFWMANTILPLSIAFIAADGTVLDIQDMKPLDQTPIIPLGPYRYAIETNQGFYRAHGIAPGDKATLPGAQGAVVPGMPGCAK